MGVFSHALQEMTATGAWYRDPEPFLSYLKRHGLPERRVASAISVDSIAQLDPELRDARVMVFRLGMDPDGRNTQFALAQAEEPNMSDYFLLDDQLFADSDPELFIPVVSHQALFSFSLIPNFTETSLVNLAVFSGLLGHALGLDTSPPLSAPATGQSTYTFSFRPRRSSAVIWEHRNGQVEVDAVLTAQRQGRPVALIVESKANRGLGSLAKHKLLYPYLALRNSIPEYMTVLLVYLRASREDDGFHFRIAQYEAKKGDTSVAEIANRRDCSVRHVVLPLQIAAARRTKRR